MFDLIRTSGRSCYIIKRDIKDAFRNIPIAPVDRPLLAFSWEDNIYIECCLPFGLTTAPFIFNLFAEGLNWLLSAYLPLALIVHYLDDFIAIFPASAGSLQHVLTAFNDVYIPLTDALGTPRNGSKDAAGTLITVLGVEIDITLLQARIPQDKLVPAASKDTLLLQSACVSYKALQCVIGFLQHCLKVVCLGRARLQSLYSDLSSFTPHQRAVRRLSHDSRNDLAWWRDTLKGTAHNSRSEHA